MLGKPFTAFYNYYLRAYRIVLQEFTPLKIKAPQNISICSCKHFIMDWVF
jgi:hypothetical protein